MLAEFWLVAGVALLPWCQATVELPERARGGLLWKEHHQTLLQDSSPPLFWNAPIDHDDPSAGTYRQKYFMDETSFKPDTGLVFLSIGGEGTVRAAPGGYIGHLGKVYSALLVSLEHRFYGDSLPNGHCLEECKHGKRWLSSIPTLQSMETENLKYLTVDQALADVAAFSDFLQSQYQQPLTFFTFGGSYPGALSAWYKIYYPDKTVGSLSSSGVVNAIMDFPQFDEQVAEAIGTECASIVRRTTAAFEKALANGKGRLLLTRHASFNGMVCLSARVMWQGGEAKALFGADEGLQDGDFFYMLADSSAMMDQYGHKDILCKAMGDVGQDAADEVLMEAFANVTNLYWGPQFGSSCFYDTRCLKDAATAKQNDRSWRWQKCSELAYFQVAPSTGSLRSTQVNLDYHFNQCQQIFGTTNKPTTDQINALYGGAQPQGSHIFFSDFSDDPWQQASVRKKVAPEEPYSLVECDGCGHCMDLHTPSTEDPAPLVRSRATFEAYLHKWLAGALGGSN